MCLIQALQPYDLIISNVIGPPVPLYLVDHRISAIYPGIRLFEDLALTVGVMSYTNRTGYGIQADRNLAPDLIQFATDLANSFEELQSVAEKSDRAASVPRRISTHPASKSYSTLEAASGSSGQALSENESPNDENSETVAEEEKPAGRRRANLGIRPPEQ